MVFHGLGYEYNIEYEQLGNSFISILKKIEKGILNLELKFKNYDRYSDFINFIENSEKLKFEYVIPFKDGKKSKYYKDVDISLVSKGYLHTDDDENLIENVTCNCLSLWYEENRTVYTIEPQSNEIRWDFEWDSKFADYDTRSLPYINKGHIEAPIEVSIDGHIINPVIELYIEGELYQRVPFTVEIKEYEKILYGTKENEFYIQRQKTDGTTEDLFNLDVIDFYNDNVIRLPKNKSCELKLKADNEILKAEVVIFPQYKAV